MANSTIGHVTCPHCAERADVRRYASGSRSLYYVCGCGIIRPNTRKGQDWILNNARMFGADGSAEEPRDIAPASTPEPAPPPEPAPEPPRQPKPRGGFLADLDI